MILKLLLLLIIVNRVVFTRLVWNQSLHISKILAEWFWKRWSWKSLNLTKVVVCFSQSNEWTKNARAVKICCCSHVFCVYYYLYKLKCNFFFWKKHDLPANNNHERSDNSLSWSADPRWSLEVFKILIFRRASTSLFYGNFSPGTRPSRLSDPSQN